MGSEQTKGQTTSRTWRTTGPEPSGPRTKTDKQSQANLQGQCVQRKPTPRPPGAVPPQAWQVKAFHKGGGMPVGWQLSFGAYTHRPTAMSEKCNPPKPGGTPGMG